MIGVVALLTNVCGAGCGGGACDGGACDRGACDGAGAGAGAATTMARSRLASRLGGGEAAETLRATSRCQSSTRRASFAVEAVVMVVGLACTLPLFGELRAYLT